MNRAMTELEKLAFFEKQAEEAYAMYGATSRGDATARYSDSKEVLYSAIIARQLKADEAAQRLEARLTHIKAVFRLQFT